MFPAEDEMAAPPEGEDESAGIDAKLREEMREWIRQEVALEMRGRLGKPMPDADEPLEDAPASSEPPEDADIPGVEGLPPGEDAAAGPDVDKLKAALAKMKAGAV